MIETVNKFLALFERLVVALETRPAGALAAPVAEEAPKKKVGLKVVKAEPAAEPEPAPAKAQPAAATAGEPSVTAADVRAYVKGIYEKAGDNLAAKKTAFKALLGEFGVDNLSNVPADQIPAFLDQVKAALEDDASLDDL